jgi:hypothetical protein
MRFLTLAYKWCTALRIAYGHIEFERARDFDLLDTGRAFGVLADRSLVPHERTEARTRGIQTLKATFRDWLPQLDRQIFLMGFDAGEQFVLRMGSENYTETFLAPIWSGNFMPPQVVQQTSKRDLLSQLPSQALRDELAKRERSCTTQSRESQPLSGFPISSSTHSSIG